MEGVTDVGTIVNLSRKQNQICVNSTLQRASCVRSVFKFIYRRMCMYMEQTATHELSIGDDN